MLSTDAEGQLALRAVLQKKPGEELHLGRAIRLAGWPPMSNAKVLARCPAAVHLELFPETRELLVKDRRDQSVSGVSDPIMFGHCVKAFFKDVFAKYADTFEKLGVNANNGLGDLYKKIAALPDAERQAIEADLKATYETQPRMAMVDSHKGITNLHVPSDIIIDNSMPTAIRAGGKMWDADDTEQDFKAAIPDRSYAGVFSECVEFCKKNGAFDPKTMGACPNVGLMAQKAEEYGSHPTTFEAKEDGTIRIVNTKTGAVLLGHRLHQGDIWRSCQTKDAPIKDWVKLAVHRCRENNFPKKEQPCKAIFWLDPARAHDCNIISKVLQYLPEFDTKGLDLEILSPAEAMRVTCERAKQGLNTITVTGNVLRDYLTDLFPILELGTSAKMLSIVPMLAGGGMYETGAGGSAPKHVQQFTKEGHLRWDSLGEYLALSESIQDLARETNNTAAGTLGAALDKAVGTFLSANKNPSRKVKELQKSEETILKDLIECQGSSVDIGGYYRVDKAKADKAMNPSETFNKIILQLASPALAAFEVALSALSPLPDLRRTVSWAKAQSLLLRIDEHLLELPATEYLSGLSLGDLRAALAVADGTLGKRVSSVLHDFFGYCSVTSAALHETRTPEQEARARRLQLFVAAESQEAGASFLAIPWALGCRSWPLAVRIVACLSGDAERLLRLHCEDWLVACQAEALGDSAWFRSGALRSLATLVRHQGSEVCTWLADCCQPGGAMAPAEVAILARSLHGKVPSRDGPKETFLLELGAICALARLELRRTRGSDVALPETFADFAALVAQEAPAAKRCAAKAAAALLNSEEALEELAQMLRGTDLAAALRALDHLERFAAVRGLETAAKVRPSTCVMARQCLAALARDVEADISRPALCVIACAVHDDNEEVRQWARKFLTDASWTPPSSEGSSMCFFVGMVRNMVGSENVL
ncbi:unnamed protein product [Effrenium voratum]|nr:unnamed protein product [Effrenium voratum]